MKSMYKDKDWLYDQYWNQGKNSAEMAEECDCCYRTILKWMVKFNIPRRSKSEAKKREKNPMFGRKHSKEAKKKMSKKMKGKNNSSWKGDKVGTGGLHRWVKIYKPEPQFCEICGNPGRLELSNITGKSIRDINNFQWVHHSCHRLYDLENNIEHEYTK